MTRHYAPPPPKPPQRTGSAFDILKEIAERRAQLAALADHQQNEMPTGTTPGAEKKK